MKGSTYTPNRLQKAIGTIAGAQLGFNPSPEGGVKPLPETSAEIVEIKKIYPTRRYVDFCFLGSDTIHSAYAMVDYWHREGTDDFQPPENLNLPFMQKERSWPYTTPENNSPDLATVVQLILLSGAPNAPAMPPIILQLNQILGGQQNTVKLLQMLSGSGSLNLSMLFGLIGLKVPSLEDLKNPEKLKDLTQIPDIQDLNKIEPITNNPKAETPKEPLHGAVIPLKGDKTQGYLLLGFIKLT